MKLTNMAITIQNVEIKMEYFRGKHLLKITEGNNMNIILFDNVISMSIQQQQQTLNMLCDLHITYVSSNQQGKYTFQDMCRDDLLKINNYILSNYFNNCPSGFPRFPSGEL